MGPLGPASNGAESRAKLRELVPRNSRAPWHYRVSIGPIRTGGALQTTLVRNGKHFSFLRLDLWRAAVSSEIHIWTDGDGRSVGLIRGGYPDRHPRVIDFAFHLQYDSMETLLISAFARKSFTPPQRWAPAVASSISLI